MTSKDVKSKSMRFRFRSMPRISGISVQIKLNCSIKTNKHNVSQETQTSGELFLLPSMLSSVLIPSISSLDDDFDVSRLVTSTSSSSVVVEEDVATFASLVRVSMNWMAWANISWMTLLKRLKFLMSA